MLSYFKNWIKVTSFRKWFAALLGIAFESSRYFFRWSTMISWFILMISNLVTWSTSKWNSHIISFFFKSCLRFLSHWLFKYGFCNMRSLRYLDYQNVHFLVSYRWYNKHSNNSLFGKFSVPSILITSTGTSNHTANFRHFGFMQFWKHFYSFRLIPTGVGIRIFYLFIKKYRLANINWPDSQYTQTQNMPFYFR